MRLRNKETGEIGCLYASRDAKKYQVLDENGCALGVYDTLPCLIADWEDHEEPKDIWWLDNEGNINYATSEVNDSFKKNREIGNYFKTREEAELAVRKLKAWRRLRDKGIEISHYDFEGNKYETTVEVTLDIPPSAWSDETKRDLGTICGGEE